MEELLDIYSKIKHDIERRLREFETNGKDEEEIMKEFVFCLLTPQSKARVCWNAVERIFEERKWEENHIVSMLKGVRFRHKKAAYVVEAVKKFDEVLEAIKMNEHASREWLVKNIKGMGYKEASHFLRNIGRAKNLAILDRHILKNMRLYGIIDEVPSSMSEKKYKEIEKKFIEFAHMLGISPLHLDFILWYKEAGEVFK
ncbi:MAG: N-glycosylase/DNA lyase [Thermoplasmata archaeon]|nr:N-glycosylase/DNA lyase [Thermoplasmata archaeon]